MGRKRHPSKEVEAALKVLEAVGWTAKEAKGRSAHAWGYVLCPANAGDVCRSGVFCRMSVWSTPRSPWAHARELLRKADGCVLKGDSDHD